MSHCEISNIRIRINSGPLHIYDIAFQSSLSLCVADIRKKITPGSEFALKLRKRETEDKFDYLTEKEVIDFVTDYLPQSIFIGAKKEIMANITMGEYLLFNCETNSDKIIRKLS